MGLLDDAENLAGEHPDQVQNVTQDAEKVVDEKTGGKFDSEVKSGGNKLDQVIENQGGQGQSGQGQSGQGQ